jgi:hypothetical protein
VGWGSPKKSSFQPGSLDGRVRTSALAGHELSSGFAVPFPVLVTSGSARAYVTAAAAKCAKLILAGMQRVGTPLGIPIQASAARKRLDLSGVGGRVLLASNEVKPFRMHRGDFHVNRSATGVVAQFEHPEKNRAKLFSPS